MALRHSTIPAVFALMLIGGCASQQRHPTYAWHGQEPVLAVYAVETLHSELPQSIPPQSIRAAAERTLRHRGYTITTSEATNDRTRIVARPPDSRLFKRVIVGSSLSPNGTRISVRIEPGGNETTSRDMLESILTLLGH